MRRNVAGQYVGCQLISKTDGSAVTAGTTTVYVTGDAGTQAAGSVGSGACTHEGNGFWTYAPAQAETNYSHVAFTFVNSSAVNVTVQLYPLAYDSSGQMTGVSLAADQAVNVTKFGGTSVTGRDIGASVLLSSGTGTGQISLSSGAVLIQAGTSTGQLDFTSGVVKANVTQFGGAAGTFASGRPEVNATHLAGTAYASADFSTTMKASINTEADTALADVGLTTTITGRIDAAVSTRLASASYTAPPSSGTIAAAVWNSDLSGYSLSDLAGYYLQRTLNRVELTYSDVQLLPAVIPSAATVAEAVWDEALSGHSTSGSTGAALTLVKTVTDKLNTMIELTANSPGDYEFSADALRKAPTGSGGGSAPSAGAIADAVCDELLSGHTTPGSVGAALSAIVTKTDQLDFDGGNVLADLRAISAAPVAVDTGTAGTVSFVSGAYVATSGGTVNANITQIDGENVVSDGNGRIRVDVSEVADAVFDEPLSGHSTSGSAGKALYDADRRGALVVARGTVTTGASTTSIPTSALSPAGAVADQFKGRIVIFDADTATAALRGQATDITASTSSATPTLTVTALTTAPSSGDTFSIC